MPKPAPRARHPRASPPTLAPARETRSPRIASSVRVLPRRPLHRRSVAAEDRAGVGAELEHDRPAAQLAQPDAAALEVRQLELRGRLAQRWRRLLPALVLRRFEIEAESVVVVRRRHRSLLSLA